MFQHVPVISVLLTATLAQFPPAPVNVTSIRSELDSSVSISYKELPGDFCETTEGVRSFSGYVHLPQSTLTDLAVDFDINTFFLYFEAREDKDNAPLLIYLAGGPGESSSYSAVAGEGGPCYVNTDGSSTTLTKWSYNNHANVLYIDQPVSAGFSYTSRVNATYDLQTNEIIPLENDGDDVAAGNMALGPGTYSNPETWMTTNTSAKSAQALWRFAEHWLTQFPEYTSSNKKIGVWGNSHGGYWAPATAAAIASGINETDSGSPVREWTVDNVGLTNACVDIEHDLPYWPTYNYNNTYKPLITEEEWESAENNFTKESGCRDAIRQCRSIADEQDPDGAGTNSEVNEACRQATGICFMEVGMTLPENISPFDIAVVKDPAMGGLSPCEFYLPVLNYFNQAEIQAMLGVQMNWTYISQAVLNSYSVALDADGFGKGTGDAVRANSLDTLTELRAQDPPVKLALVYGDRDARCPWIAAEAYPSVLGVQGWDEAGYEFMETEGTERGAAIKQVGDVSFARVFQAGHSVGAYSPEVLQEIVARTLTGKDVATGDIDVGSGGGGYVSEGPRDSLSMLNETLPDPPMTCMVNGAFQNESVWQAVLEEGQGAAGGNGTASGESGQGDDSADSSSSSSAAPAQLSGDKTLLVAVVLLGLGVVY